MIMSRDLAEWPPLLLGHYWKQNTEKEKEWKRGRTERKETEGGCSRLVHAVHWVVQHLMKAHGNRFSVLYHRESHRSRFILLTLIPGPFAHERRNTIPQDYSLPAQAILLFGVCAIAWACVYQSIHPHPEPLILLFVESQDVIAFRVHHG